MTDYLILGGGLAGCALATRLKEYNPSASVTVIEAGPDEHNNPLVTEPMNTFQLHLNPLEYNYSTVPQKAYDGRQVYNSGGKLLSGSSSVNYAMWTRGGASDYDNWANLVGDKRWSYDGQLPYFRRTETHHDFANVDPKQHGDKGPIHTITAKHGSRDYPLRDLTTKAFEESSDLKVIADANGGNPIGIGPYTENWRDGKRQPSGKAYGLKGVEVITNATVRRVLFDGNTATGAELVDGRIVTAKREVIVSCGTLRTPQVLLLSGVGAKEDLDKLGIKQVVDSPEVGGNFHDHCCVALFYKVKEPEKGNAAGSAAWNNPTYMEGMPADLVVVANAPREPLKAAMIKDGEKDVTDQHPHLQPNRGHMEVLPIYAPTEAPLTQLNVPFDGTCITFGALNLLPTSRGSVKLASTDPDEHPLIDPNYFYTEADKVVMREAVRLAVRAAESPSGRKMLEGEFPPAGLPALTSASSDEEIDRRVKRVAATWFHPAGTAAMGKVVDTDLKVVGAKNLRVVDPSVLPCPIGAHYQVCTYALAEQAAEIITAAWK